MARLIYSLPALAGLLASVLQADWMVVETFDNNLALDHITDVRNLSQSDARSEILDGRWVLFPGDLYSTSSSLYALLNLGHDLRAAAASSGKPVTVYLEVTQPWVSDGNGSERKAIVDIAWGLSNVGPASVLTERFNSFNALQWIYGFTEDSDFDQLSTYNGNTGDYELHQPLSAGTTYRIWLVLGFGLNVYQAYIQGGQWTGQTVLAGPGGTSIFRFRTDPSGSQAVQHLLVVASRGVSTPETTVERGRDPFWIDNVAIDLADQNLSAPEFPTAPQDWAGFPFLDGFGNVDTGTWLGTLNAAHAPFIWNYRSASWQYIPEASVTTQGGWVFHYRN